MNSKRCIVYLALLCISNNIFGSGFDSEKFPLYRPIEIDLDSQRLVAVDLDEAIWERTQDIQGIRVVENGRYAVPAMIGRSAAVGDRSRMRALQAKIHSVQPTAENDLDLKVTLGSEVANAALLEISTPMRDFERLVSVYGVKADGPEEQLVDRKLIYDYTRFINSRSTSVDLPDNSFREFRIRIHQVTDELADARSTLGLHINESGGMSSLEYRNLVRRTFRIDAIRMLTPVPGGIAAEVGNVSLKSWQVVREEEKGVTVIRFETYRMPFTGVAIETDSRNFSRSVNIEQLEFQERREVWRTVFDGNIINVQFNELEFDQLVCALSEQRGEAYRIQIKDGELEPLKITGVKLTGPRWQVVFLAEPGRYYRLFYGSETSVASTANTDVLRRLQASGSQPMTVSLGEPADNTKHSSKDESWLSVLESKGFLVSAIVVMVLALGMALYRAARRVGGIGPDTDAE